MNATNYTKHITIEIKFIIFDQMKLNRFRPNFTKTGFLLLALVHFLLTFTILSFEKITTDDFFY